MQLPRIMLAAPSSGSGKTMITCGILQALKERGLSPVSFKCGPDYIDPMFHTRVIGMPSRNLDTFFTDEKTTRYLFARRAESVGISVIEGVMGFYDGLGGTSPEASSWQLASVTDTPVVLVVSAKGMSLSVIPFLKGFADYQETAAKWGAAAHSSGRASVIKGVILNRVTAGTYQLLKPLIEEQTGLRVLGYVPVLDACQVESRHLGLVTPDEIHDLQQRIGILAQELEKTVDLDGLIALAQTAPDFSAEDVRIPDQAAKLIKEMCGLRPAENLPGEKACLSDHTASSVRIAVARDEAFCFYYQDNFELLELLGAELVFFSPLREKRLPERIGGLILGGGYPELYAEQLSRNTDMKDQIRGAIEGGLPYLAECGGFMYLHETMEDMAGTPYPMVGVIHAHSCKTKRLGRFGYITLTVEDTSATAMTDHLLKHGQEIRGHEFHYFDSTDPGSDYLAKKPNSRRQWACIHGTARSAAGYPHLYYWSNPEFAAEFLRQAARNAKGPASRRNS